MNTSVISDIPLLFEGGVHNDKRGEVRYINGFSMLGVKRFYTVINKFTPMVRGWHAHKKEAKYATVISGSAIIACVKIDNFKKPSQNAPVYMYRVNSNKPSVIYIPAGYANGFMSLEKGTAITFYSTSTLSESQNDDYRFPPTYFDIWQLTGKKKIKYE